MRPTLPTLIIGGTNKAGTTSVFRYLAAHPQTCASSVKETRYFSHHQNPLAPDAVHEYTKYFRHCRSDCSVIFEASPQYLAGGLSVAKRICAVIPHVRLAFILREPADRLMSCYNSYVNRADIIVRKLSPDAFVDKVLATDGVARDDLKQDDLQLQRELYRGRYHSLLVDYLSVFQADRILILFFEELTANPQLVMRKLSEFVGLDSGFYTDFNFSVENKTRRYRSVLLNRSVHAINLRLEPTFNLFPALRRTLRHLYTTINERKQSQLGSPVATARLKAYYKPECRELGTFLRQTWPDLQLPDWISL